MKTKFLLYFAIVLFTGTIVLSCKKKDKDLPPTPAPEEQPDTLQGYLPLYVEDDYRIVDSFAYNSDHTIDKIFSGKSVNRWLNIFEFQYGSDKKCSKIIQTENNGATSKNIYYSFEYNQERIKLILSSDYTSQTSTFQYTLDNKNQVIFVGSKDTLKETPTKAVYYRDLKYEANNLKEWNHYWYSIEPDGQEYLSTFHYSFKYDDKPSFYTRVFKNNPALQILYLNVKNQELHLFSENNITEMKYFNNNILSDDTIRFIITNTYNSSTKMLEKRRIEQDGNITNYKYHVISVK
ncbi:hypothetical protein DVR12_06000 [Chitinophaga silvatica]|uniref:DUF4595 domain-containing protein n=1 Tax=Chitinophaga silvatica TaxID=2282649 RepID=A0A3E1YE26_9BACT|nr:hypothetical protein [Chitinophaga silvatica]RFS24748.1 hypothetical protein DVR12_06000 [Chitinophaga silvatica]